MPQFLELLSNGSKFPFEYVLALIALGAMGLAAFAIHAVHSIVKLKSDK